MKKSVWSILAKSSKFLFMTLFLVGCYEEPVLWNVKSEDQVIAEYVASNEQTTEFAKILDATGLSSLLSVRGPFTLFLPTDQAMQEYYTLKGVSSYLDFTDPEFLENLVRNHLIPMKIETGDFGLGAIREVNALGDYLITELDTTGIYLNKHSKIIDMDIPAANGVIHLVEDVIDPVTVSVFDVVANNPSYSLFAEGLRRTKLRDTLQLVTFPYGTKTARTRFTLLAVADTTYNRYGITTIDELISYFTDAPDSVEYLENGFYRYMEYHCLNETYFLNTFETQVYPILSYDNSVSVRIEDDYKLNYNNATKQYTGFFIEESNYPAKNGTVHTLNDILPVFEPEPVSFVLETTDYFDLKQGDYYDKYYMRWFDGQNTFQYIKWEGDYMLYYFKDHDTGKLLNDDCLSMSGWWWVEITTRKIMKGKYKLTSNLWSGQISYAVYVDGVNTAVIKFADPAETTSCGEFDWTTTERHTIKVVALSPGMLFWDTLIFTVIK